MAKEKENTSGIHIDEDDYTDQERAENKRSTKNAGKSVSDTQNMGSYNKGSEAGKNMSFGVKLFVAKSVMDSLRTGHMEKKYKKDQKAYTQDAQKNRTHSGADKTVGDAFASAFERIRLEQKQRKLEKLQEKINKRKEKEQRVGAMLDNVMQAVGQASRTSAMQNSMGQLTANTGGVQQRDIPVLSAGSDNDMEFE